MATLYLAGLLAGSLTLLPLTDKYGRKWLVFAGYFAHVAIQLLYLIQMSP